MLSFLLYFLLCLDVLLTCRVLVQIPSVILFDSFCHFDEFIGLLVSLSVFRIIYYLESFGICCFISKHSLHHG